MNIYVYVLDTLADWEIGFITAELHSRRFFKKDAQEISLKTVSDSSEPIQTMGGLTVVPDCLTREIVVSDTSVLLLPGSNTWNDRPYDAIIEKSRELLAVGGTVCAICGATAVLAGAGLLDNRPHTSNGPGFLEIYVDQPSVADGNLITAGSTGGLLWAKQILERLDVFSADTLKAWYKYFSTGKPEHFYALMQTLPSLNPPGQ